MMYLDCFRRGRQNDPSKRREIFNNLYRVILQKIRVFRSRLLFPDLGALHLDTVYFTLIWIIFMVNKVVVGQVSV
jgi:hypothetical protein